MAKGWGLNMSILENIFFQILFILTHGYQYFILFSEKLVQYLDQNDKRIFKQFFKNFMINDVKITELKIISDARGKVMHMLRNDNKIFEKFGEVYFSTIYHGAIKGWHLHKESALNYACVKGKVKLVLFDDRKDSSSKNQYQEFILSPENYFLVTIPPNIWNGFKGMDQSESIIANCLTLPHNEKEMLRKDPFDKFFNYKWD